MSAGDSCPLGAADQTRNLLVFAGSKSLIYLAAPVLYIGVTQAALCDRLGASDSVANLPGAAYLVMAFSPVIVAWLFPYISYLRWNLVACFAATSASLALLAFSLALPIANEIKVGLVILQAVVCGVTLPTADALIWEVLGRGVAESRRGLTLSLAFGIGPMFAFVGSLLSQLLLDGKLGPITIAGMSYPRNFVVLFGAAAPMMALAALLCSRAVVPRPAVELTRQPFVRGVFGGFWDFLSDRVLLTATIVIILVYTGNTIPSNMNLYTPHALGESPEAYAGYQNALRFGFKAIAGLFFGWLLARTNPKAGLLATSLTYVLAMAWAIVVTGPWYLASFMIFGAGELIGVFAPNYILSASKRSDIRRNMAFVTMLMVPAAPAGVLFGWISDAFAAQDMAATGYRVSFAVCGAIILTGIAIAIFCLPARPRPEDETVDQSVVNPGERGA